MRLQHSYSIHCAAGAGPSLADGLDALVPPLPGAFADLSPSRSRWRTAQLRLGEPAVPFALVWRSLRGDEEFAFKGKAWEASLRECWEMQATRFSIDPSNCKRALAHLRKTKQTLEIVPVPFRALRPVRGRTARSARLDETKAHVERTLGAARLARICEQLCTYFARSCDGLISVRMEGVGPIFFSAAGDPLVPDDAGRRLKTH